MAKRMPKGKVPFYCYTSEDRKAFMMKNASSEDVSLTEYMEAVIDEIKDKKIVIKIKKKNAS